MIRLVTEEDFEYRGAEFVCVYDSFEELVGETWRLTNFVKAEYGESVCKFHFVDRNGASRFLPLGGLRGEANMSGRIVQIAPKCEMTDEDIFALKLAGGVKL